MHTLAIRTRAHLELVVAAIVALTAAVVVPATHADEAVVLATDYQTAYSNVLGLETPYPRTVNLGAVCADAVVRAHGNRAYVIGRFGCDHVQVLDATQGFTTLAQWSTGNGTNPQDIDIIAPGKAYVTLYESNDVLIADPRNGATLGSISLAAFADADGYAEPAEIVRVGSRVFIAVQRLDRFDNYRANNPSFLVVVDSNTDQIIDTNPVLPGPQGIVLTGRNPFAEMLLDPVRGKILVAETGNFGALDGGIEFVDPVTLSAEGWFVSESTLGGDISAVRLWHDCSGYAVINDATFRTKLVRFDRCLGSLLGTSWQSNGFDLCDLELDANDQVLVADRDLVTPGVRIFRAQNGTQVTSSPLAFGLPPCDMALVTPPTLSGAPPVETAVLRLDPNTPDPFNPSTQLTIHGEVGMQVQLEILDVRGVRVRHVPSTTLPASTWRWIWDGRDDHGGSLPSGVYFAQVRTGRTTRTERMTLIR